MKKFIIILLFLIISQVQAVVLKVALYPYVPRIEQFQTAITEQWKKLHPNDKIEFMKNWDGGYDKNPPMDADIFVFDALFLENFVAKGYLEPLAKKDISNIDDFVPYAINGMKLQDNYYAIPQLGCTNILYSRKGDIAIQKAESMQELNSVINECTYTSQIPPDNRGLMVDMESDSTNATFYLDIAHSKDNKYPLPLPKTINSLKPEVIKQMRSMMKMSSFENSTEDTPKPYGRGKWFSEGYGRAFIGFTEHMSAMSENTRKNLEFKLFPMFKNRDRPLFYADVIGISPKTKQKGIRELAIELANVMASKETMIASIGANHINPTPQYLMSIRPSVLKKLGEEFPIYKKIDSIVQSSNPLLYKLDAKSKDWLNSMQDNIMTIVRKDYKCGCDQVASKIILNNSTAKEICTKTCINYGGWNGQWTNQTPMTVAWKSVCGCNKCTVKK